MNQYEIIVTAVHARVDLLERTLLSMLPRLDRAPVRILIHEDVKAGEPYDQRRTETVLAHLREATNVPITLFTRKPGTGLGRALIRLLSEAKTDFVFYTQEDFDFLRDVPVGRCLDIMHAQKLYHVRFNKRKTMAVKGAHRPPHEQFHKLEVAFDNVTLCVSDHWYFQASLWHRAVALEGFTHLAKITPAAHPIDRCEAAFNHWHNTTRGRGVGAIDAAMRLDTVRTFIWGPIGEPAFIQHTGHDRRSQGWPSPEKRNPNS